MLIAFLSHPPVQTHPSSSSLASLNMESPMKAWGWKTLVFFSLLISLTHGTNFLKEDLHIYFLYSWSVKPELFPKYINRCVFAGVQSNILDVTTSSLRNQIVF